MVGLTLFRKDIVCYGFIRKESCIFVVVTNGILLSIIVVPPKEVLGFGHEVIHPKGLYKCLSCPPSALSYSVEPWYLGADLYREEPHMDRRP